MVLASITRPRQVLAALSVALLLAAPAPSLAQGAAAPFTGCSASESTDLENAIIAARALAGSAATYLEGVSEDQRRFDAPYETWFGAYDGWRYGRVIANYRAIEGGLAPASTTFSCDCPSTAAGEEVHVAQGGGGIAVCKGFWLAPVSGGRSRAGALVQAASQLPGPGGAQLLAATQIESTTLAGQRPSDALRNAATYRYFAEEKKDAGAEHLPAALALILLIVAVQGFRRWSA
ncbi:MAG: M35 family metallo-endopeptidase [Deltaproteobacteria bacterium]|nr:M35 family metallo-endopeptidase [Deltaproteobacteria bacterium]